MAIEERIYILPNQITPELRAAYEALVEAAADVLRSAMVVAGADRVTVIASLIWSMRDAFLAVDAAKRAAP